MSQDETLKVYRDGPVRQVQGKPVKGDPTCYQIQCNVQPLDGRDLLIVPEGDRFKEMYWVYTNEVDNPVFVNDRVVRNNLNFQVQKVETWGSPPNGYQRCLICRIDVGKYKNP